MWRGLLFALLLTSGTIQADELKAVAQQLMTPALLQGSFTQHKHIRVLSAPLASQGQFSIVRGYGVIWRIQQPMQSEMIITEDGIYGEHVDDDRAMAYIGRILNSILAGELSALTRQFDVTVKQSDKHDWALLLEPRSSIMARAISHIELEGDKHIRQLTLHEADGDKTRIRFSDFSYSDSADDDIIDVFPSSG